MQAFSSPRPEGSRKPVAYRSEGTIWQRDGDDGLDPSFYTPPKARGKASDRPFMVWDGEGAGGHENETEQAYVLFGYQSENYCDYIKGTDLRTDQIIPWLYEAATEHDQFIHVSFGFNYDVDQMTKDVPENDLIALIRDGETMWEDYKLSYIPHKMFIIRKKGKGQKQVKIFDAMTFFGTSLVKAAEQYVPGHPLLRQVETGKNLRNSFQSHQLDALIIPYWKVENELLLETMNALRNSLVGAGITLSSWHGPGAVANTLIRKHRLATHIEQSRDEMPIQVIEAAQFSFFGGRFENPIIGHITGPVYGYDLRSAYPAALSKIPGLSGGSWRHEYNPISVSEWGLYRYILRTEDTETFSLGLGPLPNRAPNGTVSFGLCGEGWVYGHEIIAARLSGYDVYLSEGWTYETPEKKIIYPFVFTHEMYVKRSQYKRAGNPAQLGLKLGMNSVYGKLAQTVGWDEDTLLPPRYHQAWYAGQTTSWCRARIFLAMAQNPEAIIACETDGIYSREPLKLKIGEHLGEWEETRYDEMYYIQSGFYFARSGICPSGCVHNPTEKDSKCAWKIAKVRGLTAGKNAELPYVFSACDTLSDLTTYVTRYGSLTGYVGKPKAHSWFTQERTIRWGGGGKRFHNPDACPKCNGTNEEFHRTIMSRPWCGKSSPRGLPWSENPELS